ncbi:MerR family transcriptional regulator [Streptomyces albidoflavus]|uniref:MerR family transcriptional regulator n=1 Tax=Streptomyces sp. BV333 TaxID=2849673 RepID=UPI001C2DF720|nr:MerR family transcriptional regulator [Streptomyces sp. BV333]MBV1957689.1 MerR family transcriptional regulator [Streptomyces sp. BV333]
MDDHPLHTIGELSRRTGSPVRTIRFYSDEGLLPPAGRSPSGHRLYDEEATERLALVRTLRELGIGLPAVRKILDRELTLPEVAAAHAEALDAQIAALRVRRAVLATAARQGTGAEEIRTLHQLANLSQGERQSLVDEFLTAVFGPEPGMPLAGAARTLTPELPDEPDAAQLRAWLELTALSRDPDFRAHLRDLCQEAASGTGTPGVPRPDLTATVREAVAPAVATGLAPDSPRAGEILTALLTRCAPLLGGGPETERVRELTARLERYADPRRERYVRLLAMVNGWPPPSSTRPALTWAAEALRARRGQEPVSPRPATGA